MIKKILLFSLTALFLFILPAAAQTTDSASMVKTQQRIENDLKEAKKHQEKIEKSQKKIEKQQNKIKRQERKRERKMKKIEKARKEQAKDK